MPAASLCAGKRRKAAMREKSTRSTFIWLVAVSLASARPASIQPLGPTAGVATLPAGPLLLRRFCGFILAEAAQAEAVVGQGDGMRKGRVGAEAA